MNPHKEALQTTAGDVLPFHDERVLKKMISAVPEELRIVINVRTDVAVTLGS